MVLSAWSMGNCIVDFLAVTAVDAHADQIQRPSSDLRSVSCFPSLMPPRFCIIVLGRAYCHGRCALPIGRSYLRASRTKNGGVHVLAHQTS